LSDLSVTHQPWSSIPLVAYHAWKAPRVQCSFDSGSGPCPEDSLYVLSSSLRPRQRRSPGLFRQ
jgi:hypothetical protein